MNTNSQRYDRFKVFFVRPIPLPAEEIRDKKNFEPKSIVLIILKNPSMLEPDVYICQLNKIPQKIKRFGKTNAQCSNDSATGRTVNSIKLARRN